MSIGMTDSVTPMIETASSQPLCLHRSGDAGHSAIPASGLRDIDVTTALHSLREVPGLVLLDVRMPVEHAEGRIGDGLNLDFFDDAFEDQLAALDRDTPYLLYCRSGGRSAIALDMMRALGFAHVLHLTDGFEAWPQTAAQAA